MTVAPGEETNATKLKIEVSGYEGLKPIKSIVKAPKKIYKGLAKQITGSKIEVKAAKKPIIGMIEALVGAFKTPSPIQQHCWPALAAGRDMIGIAETGSGKTLAFSVPLLARLMLDQRSNAKDFNPQTVKMVVISPTRELAIQIHKVIDEVANSNGLPSMCLYGGTHRGDQVRDLHKRLPQVVVGTPGRLVDLLNAGELDFSGVQAFVLDEADRMLDMGFEPEIRTLVSAMPPSSARQTVMFSATWPPGIQTIASRYLKSAAARVTIEKIDRNRSKADGAIKSVKAAASVKQIVEVVDGRMKDTRIVQLLKEYHNTPSARTILFILYKKEAGRLESLCQRAGFESVSLHGDMSQAARESSYEAFKAGKVRLLIATDVAARGLDIPDVTTVLNYTFPLTIEDYVHRVGRTGRAGQTGVAHTLFTAAESHLAAALVAQLKAASQPVPDALVAFGGHTKKREHAEYGAFYREVDPSVKAKHCKFDDDE